MNNFFKAHALTIMENDASFKLPELHNNKFYCMYQGVYGNLFQNDI